MIARVIIAIHEGIVRSTTELRMPEEYPIHGDFTLFVKSLSWFRCESAARLSQKGRRSVSGRNLPRHAHVLKQELVSVQYGSPYSLVVLGYTQHFKNMPTTTHNRNARGNAAADKLVMRLLCLFPGNEIVFGAVD